MSISKTINWKFNILFLTNQRAHNYYDVRTLKFFPSAECWLVNSNFSRASRMQGICDAMMGVDVQCVRKLCRYYRQDPGGLQNYGLLSYLKMDQRSWSEIIYILFEIHQFICGLGCWRNAAHNMVVLMTNGTVEVKTPSHQLRRHHTHKIAGS